MVISMASVTEPRINDDVQSGDTKLKGQASISCCDLAYIWHRACTTLLAY